MSPRTEVVYDIEPFRAALRGRLEARLAGNAAVSHELFDLATDPASSTIFPRSAPRRLQRSASRRCAREAVKPLTG